MWGLAENTVEMPTKMRLICESRFGCDVGDRAFRSSQAE
jgi:hypothetical protein